MTCLTLVLKQTGRKAVRIWAEKTLFSPSNYHFIHHTSSIKFPAVCLNYLQHSVSGWPVFKQSVIQQLLHPSFICLSCCKTVAFLTYRRCKCSSSRSNPHTLLWLSTAEWSFCAETGVCSPNLYGRKSPLRWRHPGLWASASQTRWRTAEAESRADPLSREESGRGSGGVWPGPNTPGGDQK